MKTIFKDMTAQLATVPQLKWIDEDKGQMNFEPPPILFPAALVTLSLPNCVNLNSLKQNCQLIIQVKIAFDFSGNTSIITPEAARDESLAYYDIAEAVKDALQGFSTAEVNPLIRTNFSHQLRPDGYKVVVMTFSSNFNDG